MLKYITKRYILQSHADPAMRPGALDSPCVASGVFASGFRIGLRQIYPASDASVDAGPDDNSLAGASQVLRRLSHRPDYQAYPAAVLPASICVNALAILAGSTSCSTTRLVDDL